VLGSPDRPGGLRTNLATPGAVSMDGKARCMDNVFIERLWRSLRYEEGYLHAYASVAEAKAGIGAWLTIQRGAPASEPRLSHAAANLPGRPVKGGRGARRSAQNVIPFLRGHSHVSSVVDIGCGRDVWVDEWRRNGVEDTLGMDGDYVSADRLVIPKERFAAFDLSEPIRLGRRFDLVQSLEVAEHISASKAEIFIDSLVAHSDLILFSAEVPGQGSEFHINEQPYEYWPDKFARPGFEIVDFIRPNIVDIRAIEPWYRYNTLLYVHEKALDRIPPTIRRMQLRRDELIADLAQLASRLRNLTFRYLPQPFGIMPLTVIAALVGGAICAAAGQLLFAAGARGRTRLLSFSIYRSWQALVSTP
jgi:hypothetical protein